MTLEEFMKHCEVLPLELPPFRANIRTKKYQECPVCAVANKVLQERLPRHHDLKPYRLNHLVACRAIGLDSGLASMIAMAADYKLEGNPYPEIRKQLEGFCK